MMKFKNIAALAFSSFALLACGGGGGGGGDSDDSGFVRPEAPSLNLSATKTVILPNYAGDNPVSASSQSVTYITATVRQPNGDPYGTGYSINFYLSAGDIDIARIFCWDADESECQLTTETIDDIEYISRPVYVGFGLEDEVNDSTIGLLSINSLQGDVTLTATVISPDNANVTASDSITISIGNGSGNTAGVVWEHLGNMLTNDQRFINVAAYDETGGPVDDTTNNNLAISASGLTDVLITGNDGRGKSVTGRNINVSTTEGVSAISILTGSTTGVLTLTATADLADNNVDNGIQEPVSATTVIAVVSSADQIGNSISLTATTPANAYLGTEYSYSIPYSGTFSSMELVSGTLPAGLTFSSDGTISGTATEVGSFTFEVIAYAPNGDYDTQSYTLTVLSDEELEFDNLSDSYDLVVGVSFSTSITVSPHEANATIAIASGSLPPGMALSSTGTLSGTPTTAGTYSVALEASANNYTDNVLQSVTFVVGNSALLLGDIATTATVGTAYAETISLTVEGSYTVANPVAWTVSGSLPGGLSLNPGTGEISGTPTTVGSYTFTITATDANSRVATRIYTIVVSP